ncbi:MAG: V-type ATP synthase subunit E [Candidatus Altiarchaeia archaeon]
MTGSLDKIEKKIRDMGDKEIEEIEKDADSKVAQIKGEIKEEAEKAHNQVIEERKSELELIPRRILSDARMERKNEIDSRKAAMVEKAFEEAKTAVLAMNKKDKAKILKSLAENGSKQITDPVIYVDRQYEDLLPGAQVEDIKDFGVIVRSNDGTVSVDNTLNSMIKRFDLSLKPAIVKILFRE